MLSTTEENYIKNIYSLAVELESTVSTNALADQLQTKPASVSDMLKKLAGKELIFYEKYKGVSLTEIGKIEALKIIRKHRLWEVFLVEKLKFGWEEVHAIAEQLEHVKSPILIEKLDEFLNHPRFDPHGDPIPDSKGQVYQIEQFLLEDCEINYEGVVTGVSDASSAFLKYIKKIGIQLGTTVKIIDKIEFDGSIEIAINTNKSLIISKEAAKNIYLSNYEK